MIFYGLGYGDHLHYVFNCMLDVDLPGPKSHAIVGRNKAGRGVQDAHFILHFVKLGSTSPIHSMSLVGDAF